MNNKVFAIYLDGDSALHYKGVKLYPRELDVYWYEFQIESISDIDAMYEAFCSGDLEIEEPVWNILSYIFYDFCVEIKDKPNEDLEYGNGNYVLRYFTPNMIKLKEIKC